MDFMVLSLLVYLLGAVTFIWPKKAELVAHYFGMLCSIAASGLVAFSSLSYLLSSDSVWLGGNIPCRPMAGAGLFF